MSRSPSKRRPELSDKVRNCYRLTALACIALLMVLLVRSPQAYERASATLVTIAAFCVTVAGDLNGDTLNVLRPLLIAVAKLVLSTAGKAQGTDPRA